LDSFFKVLFVFKIDTLSETVSLVGFYKSIYSCKIIVGTEIVYAPNSLVDIFAVRVLQYSHYTLEWIVIPLKTSIETCTLDTTPAVFLQSITSLDTIYK